MSVVTVTEEAQTAIRRLQEEHHLAGYGLRFGLQDGGCSGYTYLIDFEEAPDEDDMVIEAGSGVQVFIHPLHIPFIQGSIIGYKDELLEAGFQIDNPNVKRSCGCGESFEI